MEFRDYANRETSALVGRLLSSQADTQVRSVREALDAAVRALDAATAAQPQVEEDVRELVQRLTTAAAGAVQRVQQDAQASLDTARKELDSERGAKDALTASLADAHADNAGLRGELARLTERADAADRDLDSTIEAHKQVEGELAGLRQMLDSSRSEAARFAGELESEVARAALLDSDLMAANDARTALASALAEVQALARDEAAARLAASSDRDALQAEVHGLRAELEAVRGERAGLQDEAERLRADLETMRAERDSITAQHAVVRGDREALTEQIDRARAEIATMSAQIEQGRRDLAAAGAQLDAARGEIDALASRHEVQRAAAAADVGAAQAEITTLAANGERMASLLESSVRAMDGLGAAASVHELLGTLTTQVSTQFPRVAVFRVKSNHLEGEHQIGFDATDVSKLVIPRNLDSLITRAATSGSLEEIAGDELAGGDTIPFAGSPSVALAIPIAHQGETLAVLYADSNQPPTGTRTAFATLLVRHTTVLLTRLSQELKAMKELREYAVMLLQEAEQMYAADVEAGKSEQDRRRRLRETVDCARQLYAQRAALDGASAAGLLDEHIAAAVQSQPITAFAQELAAISGIQAVKQDSRRSAS